jgi:1-acyl-sn-glycerol-3-phosphate acyltransferase
MEASTTSRSKLADALSWCRSIFIFCPVIYLYTIVLGSCSLLVSFFDASGRAQHWFARLWSRLILKTVLIQVQVSGMEQLHANNPCLYAANHISALDIPTLYANIPVPFRIMAKKELFRYPFLGWHLRRSGQLAIDQSNPIASIRSLKKALETLQEGLPLVIFPEGGRSASGHIKPFMSGAFYIAIKAQVPVIPLAIAGTFEALPMNHFHIRPGPVQLLVGEPISTVGLRLHDIATLSARVQEAMENLYYSHSRLSDPRKAAATTAD